MLGLTCSVSNFFSCAQGAAQAFTGLMNMAKACLHKTERSTPFMLFLTGPKVSKYKVDRTPAHSAACIVHYMRLQMLSHCICCVFLVWSLAHQALLLLFVFWFVLSPASSSCQVDITWLQGTCLSASFVCSDWHSECLYLPDKAYYLDILSLHCDHRLGFDLHVQAL